MDTEERCQVCGGIMEKISTQMVSDSEYCIFKCEKCHHQIARRV